MLKDDLQFFSTFKSLSETDTFIQTETCLYKKDGFCSDFEDTALPTHAIHKNLPANFLSIVYCIVGLTGFFVLQLCGPKGTMKLQYATMKSFHDSALIILMYALLITKTSIFCNTIVTFLTVIYIFSSYHVMCFSYYSKK